VGLGGQGKYLVVFRVLEIQNNFFILEVDPVE
jgi:hypothetical protein